MAVANPSSRTTTDLGRASISSMGLIDEKASDVDHSLSEECKIPRSALHHVLEGVGVATKTPRDIIQEVDQHISRMQDANSLQHGATRTAFDEHCVESSYSLLDCYRRLLEKLESEITKQIAILTVSVAFLRQHSRDHQESPIAPRTMSYIWSKLYSVLTDRTLDPPLCSPIRSGQGFLSVLLCSLVKDGNIEELIRFHIWLPDGKRGTGGLHSHQPFAQSYILAGEGLDQSYDVVSTTDPTTATHAEYELAWSDGKNLSSVYKTHQTISAIANTGRLVRATPARSSVHRRDMTYTIPHAHFHTSTVADDILHATLFFFDAHRGFEKNAGVLGPIDGTSFIAHRDPAGVTAAELAHTVQAVRSWEMLMEEGKKCAATDRLEEAVDHFEKALRSREELQHFPRVDRYRNEALRELEVIQRRLEGTSKPVETGYEHAGEMVSRT